MSRRVASVAPPIVADAERAHALAGRALAASNNEWDRAARWLLDHADAEVRAFLLQKGARALVRYESQAVRRETIGSWACAA